MAARQSMTELVSRLRSVCGAAPDDLFQGVTYWTDDQLQAELDKFKLIVRAQPLRPLTRLTDGSNVTVEMVFSIPRGYWVENDFTVRDSSGSEISSATYTVAIAQEQGIVTFATDVGTAELTIDATLFDWNGAAASVWEQKAAHRFDFITIKAADYRFDAKQEYDNCVARAEWHRRRKVKTFKQVRTGFVVDTAREPRRRR